MAPRPDYLFGPRSVIWYRLTYCRVIIVGAVSTLDAVIGFSGVANALMALPNLVALLVLSPPADQKDLRSRSLVVSLLWRRDEDHRLHHRVRHRRAHPQAHSDGPLS